MGAPATRKLERAAAVSTALAILTCYGTLIAVSLLSLMGVSVAIHEGAWAGTISLFAVLAVGGFAINTRRHGVVAPLLIAALGAALIVYTMLGTYLRSVEITGFVFMTLAAVWDWRARATMADTTRPPG